MKIQGYPGEWPQILEFQKYYFRTGFFLQKALFISGKKKFNFQIIRFILNIRF